MGRFLSAFQKEALRKADHEERKLNGIGHGRFFHSYLAEFLLAIEVLSEAVLG